MSRLASLVMVACSFVLPHAAAADALQDDLKARRGRLMERLGPDTLFVAFSAPTRVYSHDVDYEYRQDSNLYYLTGIAQEGTILVLMPGNATRKEILFIKPRDHVREHWEGRLLGKADATARSGIDAVYPISQFEPFMDAMLRGLPFDLPRYDPLPEYDTYFAALDRGDARLAVIVDPAPALEGPVGQALAFANKVREHFVGVTVVDAADELRDLRRVKTPYERQVLAESVEIAAVGHLAGMRAARPGMYEYEVEATIEYTFRSRGAAGWSYPSIVGSGPNATILHYTASSRQMEPGDLLLVDAAASYEYLTGDITRTYPVSGRFSDAQKDIYRIVLAAQEAGMRAAVPGATPADVHLATVEVVKQGLLELGLITDAKSEQYRTWYTHGSVHFIGMDVHDVGDMNRPLEPGVAFVIEPGIYVVEGALDHVADTSDTQAFVAQVRAAYEKYRNIGVRVEDSFLMTEEGLDRLSRLVPRTIEEVEAYLQMGQGTTAAR